MRRFFVTLILIAFVLMPNSASTADIKTPKKRVYIDAQSGLAEIGGRWKRANPYTFLFTTPTINTAQIHCGLQERSCTEIIAYVYRRSLDGDRHGAWQEGELGIISHNYEIIEWSADRIIAVKDMPVATLEIRIFPITQTAVRIYAERKDAAFFNRYELE